MNKIHLSKIQKELVKRFINSFTDRPTSKEYDKFLKESKKISPKVKPKVKNIPNSRRGFEPQEIKLEDNFEALRDLPEGWAVVSMHDSGGNHSIHSASSHLITQIWNNWYVSSIRSNYEDLLK